MLHKLINKKNKDEQSGFTIIEVLIVLAIAGLILVVVLIAIPQLQRNQRNTARQNDAARLATSVSNWVANNNGAIPTSTSVTPILADLGELSQYTVNTTNVTVAAKGTTAESNTSLTSLQVITGAKCGTNSSGVNVAEAAPPRQFVILYATETNAGGTTGTASCIDV